MSRWLFSPLWLLAVPQVLVAGEARGPLLNVAANPLVNEGAPDAAYGALDDLFLVVFVAPAAGAGQVHGQFVDSFGVPSGPPFQVSTGPGAANPALAYDPRQNAFLVVWEEATVPVSVAGRRVGSGGAMPRGAFTILAGNAPALGPDVACSTTGREFLVVASSACPNQPGFSQVIGQRVAGAPGTGNTPGSPELNCCAFPIIPPGPQCGQSKASAPAVAYDAVDDHFLVVWEWAPGPPLLNQVDGRIVKLIAGGSCAQASCASFVPANGTLPIANSTMNEHRPDVAWSDGSNQFLVVFLSQFPERCCVPAPPPIPGCLWLDYNTPQAGAQRVSGPGLLLGQNFAVSIYTSCITLGPPRPDPDRPRVAANTSTEQDFLVVWEEVPPGNPTPPRDIRARVVLDAAPGAPQFAGGHFALTAGGMDEAAPAVAYGERCNQFLAAFEQLVPPAPGNWNIAAQRASAAASFPALALSQGGRPSVSAGDVLEVSLHGRPADTVWFLWFAIGGPVNAPPFCAAPQFIPIWALPLNPADRFACLSIPLVPAAAGITATFQGLVTPNLAAPFNAWAFTSCATATVMP